MEYEFDLVGDITLDHNFIVSKVRGAGKIDEQAVFPRPGKELAALICEHIIGAGKPKLPTPSPVVESKPSEPIVDISPTHTVPETVNPDSFIAKEQVEAIGIKMKEVGWTVKMATKLIGKYGYAKRTEIKQKDYDEIFATLSSSLAMPNYID